MITVYYVLFTTTVAAETTVKEALLQEVRFSSVLMNMLCFFFRGQGDNFILAFINFQWNGVYVILACNIYF